MRSNIRWMSSSVASVEEKRASAEQTGGAFHGGKVSPATKPRLLKPGLRTDPARGDARLHRHIQRAPVLERPVEGRVLRQGVGLPAPVCGADDAPARPRATASVTCSIVPSGADIRQHRIDARQMRRQNPRVELGVDRVRAGAGEEMVVDDLAAIPPRRSPSGPRSRDWNASTR